MQNGNGLYQRSGTVCYITCVTVTGWIRGQVLSGITVHNGNGLGQRSDNSPLNGIRLCHLSAGSSVLLRYIRQLVGIWTLNELYPTNL